MAPRSTHHRSRRCSPVDPYVIGVCGSYRVAQVLRYRAELPEPSCSSDLESFLVRDLVPAIGDRLASEGVVGSHRTYLGEKVAILLGCRGQLWCITSDLTVLPEVEFGAIGSGRLRAYAGPSCARESRCRAGPAPPGTGARCGSEIHRIGQTAVAFRQERAMSTRPKDLAPTVRGTPRRPRPGDRSTPHPVPLGALLTVAVTVFPPAVGGEREQSTLELHSRSA